MYIPMGPRTLISGLFLLVFLFSCEEKVSENQADYFIKFYGSYLDDVGLDVDATADGGAVLTGYMTREDRESDIFLMKVDAYGNQASWSPAFFGDQGHDEGYAVKTLSDGFLIAGAVTDTATDHFNMVVHKTNLEGSVQWSWELESNEDDDKALCLDIADDGRIIFGGYRQTNGINYIYSALLDANGNFIGRTDRNKENWDMKDIFRFSANEFLGFGNATNGTKKQYLWIRFNSDGNDLGNEELTSDNFSEELKDACQAGNNTFYLVGNGVNSTGTTSLVHLKKLENDQIIWSKNLGTGAQFQGKSVAVRDDGYILVAADKTIGADNRNIVLFILDPNGNEVSTKEFGSTGDQTAEKIIFSDGHIFIAGRNAYGGNSMITLIKADKNGNIWK